MRAPLHPSLLAERELTPEERAAQDESPRPGAWAGESGADLSALTQDQTDRLIRRELVAGCSADETAAVVAVTGGTIMRLVLFDGRHPASCQRGGIDSDPLVRVLAYRAWGDRDQRWFELRGVRKGDRVRTIPAFDGSDSSNVVVAWPGEPVFGTAQHDARPRRWVTVVDSIGECKFRVGARPRANPDELEIEAKPTDEPDTLVVIDGVQYRITRIAHTEKGRRAWCLRGSLSAESQVTDDRYWPNYPHRLDIADVCEQFDFDRWETQHDPTHTCVVIRAWRNDRYLELSVTERAMAESPHDSFIEACRQLSRQLGRRLSISELVRAQQRTDPA